MDRFGYSSERVTSYSDRPSRDRYGFSHVNHEEASKSLLVSSDERPQFKITVSSTGKVEEKPLPPIVEKTPDLYIRLSDLEKAFSSPWLQDYKHFGESLLHALREDPYPQKKIQQSIVSGYIRCQPYFLGCSADSFNRTTYNGHNFHISLYLTQEVRDKKSYDILPFGDDNYYLPQASLVFMIQDPENSELVGKAYGQVIYNKGRTMLHLLRLEDFGRNKVTWDDIPLGSHLIAIFNLESHPSFEDGVVFPSKDGASFSSASQSQVDELPKVGEDVYPAPYFEGFPPSPKNYFRLDDNHLEAYLDIVTKPSPPIIVPLREREKNFLVNLLDLQGQTIAQVKAELKPDGKIILENEEFSEELSPVGLLIMLDL